MTGRDFHPLGSYLDFQGASAFLLSYRARLTWRTINPGGYFAKKSGARNLVICNPNNPTGSIMSRVQVLWVLEQLPELDNIIIDESFIDFSAEIPSSIKNDVANYPNAWVFKSLGKNVGLHGLRMGFAISNEDNVTNLRKPDGSPHF